MEAKEYEGLSRGFDFLFEQVDNDAWFGISQLEGVFIEMYFILNKIENKTSDKYIEAKDRLKSIENSINVFKKIYADNLILKKKLVLSENELANYKLSYGDITVRSNNKNNK